MFKFIFTAILGFMLMGANAFAVEWARCSNADGSLKSVGKGTSGFNVVVEWFHDGEKIEGAKGAFIEAKNVVLDKKEIVKDGHLVALDYIVATQVIVSSVHDKDGSSAITDFVICKQHFDERRD